MKPVAEIDKAIKSITKSGAKLDALIQDTAVNVAEHYAQHKDTGLVNRLFLAMPKGSRRNALADWLLKFVAVGVNTGATKKEQPFIHDREKTTDALGGAKTMWYDLKPEKAVDEVFDVKTAFMRMLRHIEKSTKVEHFDRPALVAFAKAVGVPESDVPTKAAMDPLAEAAPL